MGFVRFEGGVICDLIGGWLVCLVFDYDFILFILLDVFLVGGFSGYLLCL